MKRNSKSGAAKATVFSDPHANNFQRFAKIKNGFNSRLLDVIRALRFINTYNEENAIDTTLLSGDLFHTFSFVENDVMNLVNEVLSNWYGQLYYIVGQHDLKTKADKYDERLASSLVFRNNKTIHLLQGGIKYTLPNGTTLFGMGWQDPKNFYEQEFESADIFMGHQMIDNPDIPKGMRLHKDWIEKNGYKLLIFGDIHKPDFRKYDGYNVLIPGAPLQHNFGDAGQDRGFWTVDLDTYDADFIPINTTPKFIKVQSAAELKSGDDFNFYRVEKPADVDTTGMNVAVRKEVKQAFRESGLSVAMSDEELLTKYLELKTDKNETKQDVFLQTGLKYLKECVSSAVTPKDYVIKKVEIHNFVSMLGKHTFTFVKDIFLILGSNGFGKTTLFEALYWCLFGVTTKGLAAGEVVNDTVNEDCSVIVTLEGSKDTITVHRYRKDKDFGNAFFFNIYAGSTDAQEQGSVYQIKRESTDATQEELNRMLGTNASFFKNVNYFSQEAFEFFSTLTDAGQKAICKNLMQIDRFEKAEDKVKFEAAILDNSYSKQEQQLSSDKAVLIEKEQTLKSLRSQEIIWESQHKEDLVKRAEQLKGLQARSEKINRNIEVLSAEKEDLEKQKAGIELAIPVYVDAYAAVVVELTQAIATADGNRSSGRKEYFDELKRLNTNKEKLNKDLYSIEADLSQVSNRLDELKEQVTASDSALCSLCGQKLPPFKISEIRERLQQEYSQKTALLPGMNKTKEILQSNIQNTVELIAQLETKNNFDKQDQAVRLLQARKDTVTVQQTAAKQLHDNAVNQAKLVYQEKTHEMDTQLVNLSSELAVLLRDKATCEHDYGAYLLELKAQTEVANPFSVEIKNHEALQTQMRLGIVAREEELQRLYAEQEIHQFWRVAFSNQGIISYLLDNFSLRFTIIINDILLDLTDGHYSSLLSTQKKLKNKDEYREQFEFKIFIDGKERTYKALSGGQKARINLATVATLHKIIQEQYNLIAIPFSLVALDELISELDAGGIEAMSSLISGMAKDCAVYVITHLDNFKNLFSNHVTVDYTKEKGTIIAYV